MATLVGTPSADAINGTPDSDVISGLDDPDLLSGLGGDDVLAGGLSVDRLEGGDGNDLLRVINDGTGALEVTESGQILIGGRTVGFDGLDTLEVSAPTGPSRTPSPQIFLPGSASSVGPPSPARVPPLPTRRRWWRPATIPRWVTRPISRLSPTTCCP